MAEPGSGELFAWLRSLAVDGDFTAAVEMAMGRSELETPPELWVAADEGGVDRGAGNAAEAAEATGGEAGTGSSAKGADRAGELPPPPPPPQPQPQPQPGSKKTKPSAHEGGPKGGRREQGVGRPDEEKLSMLAALRTRFHRLLSRAEVCAPPPPLSQTRGYWRHTATAPGGAWRKARGRGWRQGPSLHRNILLCTGTLSDAPWQTRLPSCPPPLFLFTDHDETAPPCRAGVPMSLAAP